MKLWVEQDGGYGIHLYQYGDPEFTSQAIIVTDEWWDEYCEVQRKYWLMQQYASSLAGYEDYDE